MRGITLFQWPWRCMAYLGVIWIVSLESVLIFSIENDQEIICLLTFNFSGDILILFFNIL
jgi:hypothetical protein